MSFNKEPRFKMYTIERNLVRTDPRTAPRIQVGGIHRLTIESTSLEESKTVPRKLIGMNLCVPFSA